MTVIYYNNPNQEAPMPEEEAIGCARPTGGPVGVEPDTKSTVKEQSKKEVHAMIKIGQKAPDFAAPG